MVPVVAPTIEVSEAQIKILGLDPLKTNDLYADAPEPSFDVGGGIPSVTSNVLYLWEKLPGADWRDPGQKLMAARAQSFIEKLHRDEPTDEDRAWPFKLPPKPYQLRIFAQARRRHAIALAPVAAGTGKTKMAIDIAAAKYMDGEIDGAAVIAMPKLMPRQWINDALPEHMTDAVKWSGYVWSSTRKTPPGMLREHPRCMRWLAISLSAFSGDKGKAAEDLKKFLSSGRMALIWDESSKGKNPKAKRTQAMVGRWYRGKHTPGLGELAKVRMILTGTPITKGIENLWSQYEFLDPSILGMSNYDAFQARYCNMVPAFWGAPAWQKKIGGYRNTEEFVRKIAPCTWVVPKDVLGLPEKTYETLPVALTPEQKKVYNALRDKLVDDLKGMRIASPANAAVRFVRLQQVLSGYVYEPALNEEQPPSFRTIPSNRVSTLLEYIEDNPGPNVIWCRFTKDISDVVEGLQKAGRTPITYGGSDETRELAKRSFIDGGATDFVANPATAGMGLDGLQRVCQRAIWYSHGFNREDRWQGEDRIHRLGMCGTALNVNMVTPGSIDEVALASYKETEDLIKSIMDRPELVPTLNEE